MNEEEYRKKVALPDDYVEQECCGNCEFMDTEFGDTSCGDPDEYYCELGQDYYTINENRKGFETHVKTWNNWKSKLWREVREVKRYGICSKYKRETD